MYDYFPDMLPLPVCSVSAVKRHQFDVNGGIWCLCMTKDGNFVVYGGSNVMMYNREGELLNIFALPERFSTYSITQHGNTIIVADRDNSRLHVCDNIGSLITSIHLQIKPYHISSDDQDLWVSDPYFNVYKVNIADDYNVDVQQVQLQNSLSLASILNTNNNARTGNECFIAVSNDRLALCYSVSNMVHTYSHTGELLFVYGGNRGHGDNELNQPEYMCYDDTNTLYITDTSNDRVVIVNSEGQRVGYIYTGMDLRCLHVSDNTLYVGSHGHVNIYSLHWH
jgi:DNA-binding beta-propeller fold protein YncE